MNTLKNKFSIFFLALLLFLGGIALFSQVSPGQQQASLGGSIENLGLEEPVFDFGSVSMKEGDVSHEFLLKNNGGDPVTIGKIYTSCMCTTASLQMGEYKSSFFGMAGHGYTPKINKTIEPGQQAQVRVLFDPAAHGPAGVGRVERIVYLESSGGEKLELKIFATVMP